LRKHSESRPKSREIEIWIKKKRKRVGKKLRLKKLLEPEDLGNHIKGHCWMTSKRPIIGSYPESTLSQVIPFWLQTLI
jgi:hypothetical protein